MRDQSERLRYRRWVEAIYRCIHASLGGDPEQGGSGRSFGEGRFTHDMTGKLGGVTFIVDLPKHPLHPSRRVGPFRWRDSQPGNVCEEVLASYRALLAKYSP